MAALRVLVLNSEITALRAQLTPLEQTRDGFAAREEQLRQALSEITETSTDEERSAVSAAVDAFENDRSANAAEIARIQGEIDTRSAEIARLEAEQTPPPASNPAVPNSDTRNNDHHERSFVPMNNTTERRWFGLTYAERDALMQSEQVRTFFRMSARPRPAAQRHRRRAGYPGRVPADFAGSDVSGVEVPSLRLYDDVPRHDPPERRRRCAGSHLDGDDRQAQRTRHQLLAAHHGRLHGRRLHGRPERRSDGRQRPSARDDHSSGACCVARQGDRQVHLVRHGRKYAGRHYHAPCRADKAHLVGLSAGRVHRSSYEPYSEARHRAKTGVEFFQPLVAALAVAKPDYSNGTVIWTMNRKTHMDIKSRALAYNSAAAMVAGVNNIMPVVGGRDRRVGGHAGQRDRGRLYEPVPFG